MKKSSLKHWLFQHQQSIINTVFFCTFFVKGLLQGTNFVPWLSVSQKHLAFKVGRMVNFKLVFTD